MSDTEVKYLSHADLRKRGLPWSIRQLARLEAAGEFPCRVRLSYLRVAWIEAEVTAWCNARNNARGLPQAA
jgi:hypothetical protein